MWAWGLCLRGRIYYWRLDWYPELRELGYLSFRNRKMTHGCGCLRIVVEVCYDESIWTQPNKHSPADQCFNWGENVDYWRSLQRIENLRLITDQQPCMNWTANGFLDHKLITRMIRGAIERLNPLKFAMVEASTITHTPPIFLSYYSIFRRWLKMSCFYEIKKIE